MRALVLAAGIFTLAATPSLSQETERFRLERTPDGYVRMDATTGAMSLCTERRGELTCRPAGERGDDAADRIAALEDRIRALEERLAAQQPAVPPAANLPSDEEFERTLSFMERFFRRFMGLAREFENEDRTPPTAEPDTRT